MEVKNFNKSVYEKIRAISDANPLPPRLSEFFSLVYDEKALLVELAKMTYEPEKCDALVSEYEAALRNTIAKFNAIIHGHEIEPGEPICKVTCPCCGANLEIEHGDDEGELAVVGIVDNTRHVTNTTRIKF